MPISDVMTIGYVPQTLWSTTGRGAGRRREHPRRRGQWSADRRVRQERNDAARLRLRGDRRRVDVGCADRRWRALVIPAVSASSDHLRRTGCTRSSTACCGWANSTPCPDERRWTSSPATNACAFPPTWSQSSPSTSFHGWSTSTPVEIEEGLFIPPTVSGPIPMLTVKLGADGVRAYWSIRYEVNGQHHDFDPDSGARSTGLPGRRRRGPRLVDRRSCAQGRRGLGADVETTGSRTSADGDEATRECRAARRAGRDRQVRGCGGCSGGLVDGDPARGCRTQPGRGRGPARRGPATTGLQQRLRDRVGQQRARIPCRRDRPTTGVQQR